jgi:2-polyprenyl-6-methoxyphenol hydroxylase-like FAD-dependent oxidoreductase
VGDKARNRAVFTDYMVMHDAIDEYQVGKIPTGENFRKRFGNPYAVIHRVDIHTSLLEGAQETGVSSSTPAPRREHRTGGRQRHRHLRQRQTFTGQALIGADGVRSVVRAQYVNDPPRVTGHVVYRAVIDKGLPENLQVERRQHLGRPQLPPGALPAARRQAIQRGRHLPQPRQGRMGRHRRQQGGSAELLPGHLPQGAPADRPAQELEALGHRRPRADRQWTFGRATLLGDAAHPTTQYMAQGACMALEDAVTLGEALRVNGNDWSKAL